MKAADRSGARFALVLGERDLEAGAGRAQGHGLRGSSGPVPLDDVVAELVARLA